MKVADRNPPMFVSNCLHMPCAKISGEAIAVEPGISRELAPLANGVVDPPFPGSLLDTTFTTQDFATWDGSHDCPVKLHEFSQHLVIKLCTICNFDLILFNRTSKPRQGNCLSRLGPQLMVSRMYTIARYQPSNNTQAQLRHFPHLVAGFYSPEYHAAPRRCSRRRAGSSAATGPPRPLHIDRASAGRRRLSVLAP